MYSTQTLYVAPQSWLRLTCTAHLRAFTMSTFLPVNHSLSLTTRHSGSLPPHLISSALMSLHLLLTQSSSLACTVNMLNHLSTNTWCTLYTHTGVQCAIYVLGHNNCIPKGIIMDKYLSLYLPYNYIYTLPRYDLHTA